MAGTSPPRAECKLRLRTRSFGRTSNVGVHEGVPVWGISARARKNKRESRAIACGWDGASLAERHRAKRDNGRDERGPPREAQLVCDQVQPPRASACARSPSCTTLAGDSPSIGMHMRSHRPMRSAHTQPLAALGVVIRYAIPRLDPGFCSCVFSAPELGLLPQLALELGRARKLGLAQVAQLDGLSVRGSIPSGSAGWLQ